MKILLLFLLLFLFVYILFEIYRSRTQTEVEEIALSLPGLPAEFDGFRIAFLSDLHEGAIASNLPETVKAAAPDAVLFGGDMLHKKHRSSARSLALMESLSGPYPVYAACGNHEEILKEKNPPLWEDFLSRTKAAGVCWLQNEWTPLKKGDKVVFLGGISVYYDYYYHPKGHNTSDYLGEAPRFYPPPEGVRILMAHDPIQLSIYTKWEIDLVLSGHVHGGIVRLPGLGGLLSPARTFCPPRDNGLYRRGKTQMVVSRGLGNRAFIPRFWNRPHLPVIILKKEAFPDETV